MSCTRNAPKKFDEDWWMAGSLVRCHCCPHKKNQTIEEWQPPRAAPAAATDTAGDAVGDAAGAADDGDAAGEAAFKSHGPPIFSSFSIFTVR